MESEADRFMRILNSNNLVNFFGKTSKEYLELFSKRIETMSIASFDKPDIVIGDNEFTYFLEHFEFDSSLNTKKGTEMRIEEARVSRDFSNYVNDNLDGSSEDTIIKRDTYTSDRAVSNYVSNFVKNYKNHYNKLNSYIDNAKVKDLNMPYEFGFVIENTSNLPDIILNEKDRTQILLPIHIGELLKLFKESPEIKNIFYITHSNMSKHSIFYFRNVPSFYDDLIELKIRDYTNNEIINFKGHSFGFAIPIPK
jgi:hypothetical protein